MRGTADLHLIETPLIGLIVEVTGVKPEASGHVLLDHAFGVRSTQRLALGDVGGGVVAFTWPAELVPQANYLYSVDRAQRLLAAAREGGWSVDTRPHLAFWNSRPSQRLYSNPTIDVDEYVSRWAGPDGRRIGQHEAAAVRAGLWPWMLERGFASADDGAELDRFLTRLGNRPAHLRPGLRLLRRWSREEAETLKRRGDLADTIRSSVNDLLRAVSDPTVPAP